MGDTLKTYLLVTNKPWHDDLFASLSKSINANWIRISSENDFTIERIDILKPDKVFIPHWSSIIPAAIYDKYECIVFHMTDLPFGRGGSPLQNLITRGFKQTMISAIKIVKEIDAGDVYLKKELSLEGTAREIFERSSAIIKAMIAEIINNEIQPRPQEGEVTIFKRRKPRESSVKDVSEIEKLYDHIRMLDCEGYPAAYLETDYFKLEFTSASLQGDATLLANVRITKR